jgi:hypothetical protein
MNLEWQSDKSRKRVTSLRWIGAGGEVLKKKILEIPMSFQAGFTCVKFANARIANTKLKVVSTAPISMGAPGK